MDPYASRLKAAPDRCLEIFERCLYRVDENLLRVVLRDFCTPGQEDSKACQLAKRIAQERGEELAMCQHQSSDRVFGPELIELGKARAIVNGRLQITDQLGIYEIPLGRVQRQSYAGIFTSVHLEELVNFRVTGWVADTTPRRRPLKGFQDRHP